MEGLLSTGPTPSSLVVTYINSNNIDGSLFGRAALATYQTNICVFHYINILLIPTINIASGCQETICSRTDGKYNYDSR